MKRLLIFTMLAVCASPKAFAQGVGSLAGRVVDEFDGMGLPGAHVIVEGTSLGAATNLDGEYEIHDVPVGLYNVTARFIGYEDVTETDVEVRRGYTKMINFELAGDIGDFAGPCHHTYGRRLVSSDIYAPRVLWRATYSSGEIDFVDLPIER